MTQLVLPRRFTQQPQQAVQVDLGGALAKGLIAAAIPYSRRDSVSGKLFSQVGVFSQAAGPAGIGLVTNGVDNSIYLPIPPVTLTKFSLIGLFKSASAALDTRAIALGNSLDNNPIVQIGTGSLDAAKVRVFARDNAAATPAFSESSVSAFDGNLHSAAITYDGATVRCYVDGKFDTSIAFAAATFTVDRFSVGALQRGAAAAFWAGSTYFSAAYSRTLSDADVAMFANPWQTFKAPSRRIWISTAAGAPAGTAALTGTGATGATGAASPSTGIAATGNSSTGAVGTASPSTSVAATGNTATGSVGAVATGITVGLTGIGATGAVGSVSTGTDVTAALSGVGATAAVGSLAVDRAKAITGTSATAGTGTATVSRESALSGAGATAQAGSVVHDHVIGLTGTPATGAVGSVGATQAGVASLTGTPSTASAGTATASLSVAATGVSGSGQVGAPVVARESAIAGVGASSAVGSVGLSVTVALSGITATASVGTVVVPSGDIVVAITGVSVIGLVGTMVGSDVIYARAPSGSGYRREFSNTTRPTQQNTTRNPR